MSAYTEILTAADVTDEITEMVEDCATGWPDATTGDILERVEGYTLSDGTSPDFGGSADSPAIRKVRRIIREARRG